MTMRSNVSVLLQPFYKYLAQPNAIAMLSLAGTECALEQVFDMFCLPHLMLLVGH